MKNRWSHEEAARYCARYQARWGGPVALQAYANHLLGGAPELVLHGGGNSSVKGVCDDLFSELAESGHPQQTPALFMKPSGLPLKNVLPESMTVLDLLFLQKMGSCSSCSDILMRSALERARMNQRAATPSIETLLHAFLPHTVIHHTHPEAILALTNRTDGQQVVQELFGEKLAVVAYFRPGFDLAKASLKTFEKSPDVRGLILMQHGLVTWGETAYEAYASTIECVTRAEEHLRQSTKKRFQITVPEALSYEKTAPLLRGVCAVPTEDPNRPYRRSLFRVIRDETTLALIETEQGREMALSPPLTPDHVIHTGPFPLWIDRPTGEASRDREQFSQALQTYAARYQTYLDQHSDGITVKHPRPHVIFMPGVGIICLAQEVREADIIRDLMRQTLRVKLEIRESGGSYLSMTEAELFEMEYHLMQRDKISDPIQTIQTNSGSQTILVTGAAGAIGFEVCRKLLEEGYHVAASDLDEESLQPLVHEKQGHRVLTIPLDVTDPKSVSRGFDTVIRAWGGVDGLVHSAGVAHVAALDALSLKDFRSVEQINIDGTLNLLSEAARHFKRQRRGGDIVLLSTKNVFAPGAHFGAYSATKAAAHQLARIASLEMAADNIRVNMVAPDAVFGNASRPSGLWAEVGPDRMRARGLSEADLEAYYHNRNLLKTAVTAEHVARAVLYFISRQTPTTGVTLPVDGGLPDATPR